MASNSESNRINGDSCSFLSELNDDIHLRAPIPIGHSNYSYAEDEEWITHSLLCRMYVACGTLKLGTETRFTSMVLFRRYVSYYFHLKQKQKEEKEDWHYLGTVAASCLFLGCKVEEEPRRLRDVINVSHLLCFKEKPQNNDDKKTVKISLNEEPPFLDDTYWESKKTIVDMEQHILRMFQFDANVSHPYRAVLLLLQALQKQKQFSFKQSIDLVQKKSFQLINNCIFYEPALRIPILPLACAAIDYALDELHDTTKTHMHKWNFLFSKNDISQEELIIARTAIIQAKNSLLPNN